MIRISESFELKGFSWSSLKIRTRSLSSTSISIRKLIMRFNQVKSLSKRLRELQNIELNVESRLKCQIAKTSKKEFLHDMKFQSSQSQILGNDSSHLQRNYEWKLYQIYFEIQNDKVFPFIQIIFRILTISIQQWS